MATAATSISDKQLDAELRQLQTEAAALQKKLDDDTRKFGAASTDRQRIVEGIARGTVNVGRNIYPRPCRLAMF